MLKHDFIYSLRSLRKNAGLATVCVLTLALGIGVNTALFTVVNTVLLRPMNYPEADRIVEVTRFFGGSERWPAVSATQFDFWQQENHCFRFTSATQYRPSAVNLTGRGEPQQLLSLSVSAGFFQVLGVRPLLGQTFTAAQDKPGSGHYAVLSWALWDKLFHNDPSVIGKTLTLGGNDYVINGVMPANFDFPEHAEVWTPLQLRVNPADRSHDYKVIARLKEGVSLSEAKAQMRVTGVRLRQRFGDVQMAPKESVDVVGLQEWIVGDVRPTLLLLMGAVGFVLLLACANVANLLLARSAGRQHELALRKALGATGWQLSSQLLIESLLLSLLGGLGGLYLARLAIPLLVRLAPVNLPLASNIAMDWHVLLFALGSAIASAIIFGLFPAMQAMRADANESLRDGTTRTTGSSGSQRVRRALVIFEVAVSLVLLAGAGLLVETVTRLNRVSPGFNPQNVLTMETSLTADAYASTAATAAFTHRVVTRLEAIPGIQSVGIINTLPFEIGSDLPFEITGHPTSEQNMPDELVRAISPRYFETMRIPLVAGREFSETDRKGAQPVIIINQALARKYFKKGPVLGQTILIGRIMGPMWGDVAREVVGIAGDTMTTD